MPASRLTLRQRYIAFGIIFALLTVGAMIGLGYWLVNIDDKPQAGAGVAPVPEVDGTGERVTLVGTSLKLPSTENGVRVGQIVYRLTADPRLSEQLAATHGKRIRVVGIAVNPRERLISVNRFFDLTRPGAGPTPARPRPLPPERPTTPDGDAPAQPGQPGTPGGAAVNEQGTPTGGRLPAVGQRVRVAGVLRIDSNGDVILIDNRGDSHRIWGAPGMINRLRKLDNHRVIVQGTAILGSGSNRNYTITASRVIDRGPVDPPESGPTNTTPTTTSGTGAPVASPSAPVVIAPDGSVAPLPPPPAFASGFEDGLSAWASGCGGDGALRVIDAGACGAAGGGARIATTGDVVRSGSRALSVTTRTGDGGPLGGDENSLPWTGDTEGQPGTVSTWKMSVRVETIESSMTIASWRSVGCPAAPAPVAIVISAGVLGVATAGGTCASPKTNFRFAYGGRDPWRIRPGVWNDLTITIRWGEGAGLVSIRSTNDNWSAGGFPVGYREPDSRVIMRVGLIRASDNVGEDVIFFDDISYAKM